MAARQCHQMPLVEIDLNMDVMHSFSLKAYSPPGNLFKSNPQSASKFKSKSCSTFFFSMFSNILDLDKGLESKSMEFLPPFFLLEIFFFFFA